MNISRTYIPSVNPNVSEDTLYRNNAKVLSSLLSSNAESIFKSFTNTQFCRDNFPKANTLAIPYITSVIKSGSPFDNTYPDNPIFKSLQDSLSPIVFNNIISLLRGNRKRFLLRICFGLNTSSTTMTSPFIWDGPKETLSQTYGIILSVTHKGNFLSGTGIKPILISTQSEVSTVNLIVSLLSVKIKS